MKTTAMLTQSMLTRDATMQRTSQTSPVASRGVWSWGGGGVADETSTVF